MNHVVATSLLEMASRSNTQLYLKELTNNQVDTFSIYTDFKILD